jgi:hypothetical protein
VRDDIPARLSEGEFVFPADVVRYIGLEKLMQMRQKAKAGLARMEEMGQMGNSEEATIPDDAPFTIEDLDMEEETEYNQGGIVKAQTGTAPPIPPATPAPIGGFTPQFYNQQDVKGTAPSFETLVGRTPGQYDEFREYVNEAGMKLQIPFKDGQPIYPIPEGYTFVDPEEEKVVDPKVTDVKPQTTRVTDVPDSGDDSDPTTTSASLSFGGTKDPNNPGLQQNAITANISYNVSALGKFGVISGLGKVADINQGKDVNTIGNKFGLTTKPVEMSYGKAKPVSVTAKEYANIKNNTTGKNAADMKERLNTLDALGKNQISFNTEKGAYMDSKGNEISLDTVTQAGKDINDYISQEVSKGRDTNDVISGLTSSEIDAMMQHNTEVEDQQTVSGKGTPTSIDLGYEEDRDDEKQDYSDTNTSDPGTGGASMSDYGDADEEPVAKGGLLKRKPKVKKMKRGGLASR